MSRFQKRCVVLCLLIVLGSLSFAQQRRGTITRPERTPAKEMTAAEKELAKQLLTKAQALAPQLSDTDRAVLLGQMAEAWIKLDRDHVLSLANEAFELSVDLKDGFVRGRAQMSAIMAASDLDPEQAVAMLLRMQAPAQRDADQSPLDVRAGISTMLFQRMWKKQGVASLDSIQAAALTLGEGGAYPYMAIGPLVRQVSQKDPERAERLVQDAVNFLGQRAPTGMESHHVAAFLRNAEEFVPASLMKETLEKLVTHALTAREAPMLAMTATFEDSKGSKAEFTKASTILLFELMPMIRKIDPDWALRLEKEHEELRRAAAFQQEREGEARFTMAARIEGPGDGVAEPVLAGDPRDAMTAIRIDELARVRPNEALNRLSEIKDPTARAAASARIAGAINDNDPEQAAKLLREAREALARAKDDSERLSILVSLAQAQAKMKGIEAYKATLDRAFSLGEGMFRKGVDRKPGNPFFFQPGFEDLRRLTHTGMQSQPREVIAKIDELRLPSLQAALTVAAVKALDASGRDAGMGIMIEIED